MNTMEVDIEVLVAHSVRPLYLGRVSYPLVLLFNLLLANIKADCSAVTDVVQQ